MVANGDRLSKVTEFATLLGVESSLLRGARIALDKFLESTAKIGYHFFPIRERLVKGARDDPNTIFLVNDLPPVLRQIEVLNASIKRILYNFFIEQPIKGARAYYIYSVFYN
ncbi:hypothetical protein D0859_17114 [Hortaea werneckii]|uniref:Uncharacterized protein n=1 Tax=Hortaea werneckii TaxID=91943 RepID=A0A3M7I0C3_HORWE|nr:hypothetical protein D0859_17114 [Hortaea werneckii]